MLLSDDQLRRKMGAAGREETLNWDWKAATSVLRNKQYSAAEKRCVPHSEHNTSAPSSPVRVI